MMLPGQHQVFVGEYEHENILSFSCVFPENVPNHLVKSLRKIGFTFSFSDSLTEDKDDQGAWLQGWEDAELLSESRTLGHVGV